MSIGQPIALTLAASAHRTPPNTGLPRLVCEQQSSLVPPTLIRASHRYANENIAHFVKDRKEMLKGVVLQYPARGTNVAPWSGRGGGLASSSIAKGFLRPAVREVLIVVGLFALFAALTLPMFVSTESRDVRVSDGQIAIPRTLLAQRPVVLEGEWSIERIAQGGRQNRALVKVPGPWEGLRMPNGHTLRAGEAMLYRLTVHDVPAGDYRMFLPSIWGASQVYVDGRLRSSSGRMGYSAATSVYELRRHDVGFSTEGGDVRLAIAITTYNDIKNGLRIAPVMGTAATMDQWIALVWARTFYISVTFVLIGLFALIVYVNRPVDRSSLYLALGAFGLLGVQGIHGLQNLLLVAAPGLSHELLYAALILCTYGGIIAWVAYVEALFPDRTRRHWYLLLQAIVAVCGTFVAGLLIVGGTLLATRVISLFLVCMVMTFVFVFSRTISAVREGRDGAILLFLGQVAVVVSTGLQATVNLNFIAPGPIARIDLAGYGLIIFAFTHLVVLARRWSVAIVSAEVLSEDLGRLLEVNSAVASESHLVSLLERIAGVTSRIIDAERTSIFIHDPERGELWTLVAEGMEAREIRIPEDRGIAGHSFQLGQAVHVSDPYSDPRFNPAVDRETGFVTRNMLCSPLVTRDGRKLGVLQVLNSRLNEGFKERDMTRLAAFSAQAAVAIDNANLFAAVLESRNYNERILSSMSSGVVTLQDDARRARLNDAAARILGVSKDDAETADAREFVGSANPWLAEEIAQVAAGEVSKTFLDSELVTVGNGTISANLSLVPLRDGDRATGVLMMIDDISASKRLEGTIRRFMTQEVMDQVLAHDGDALFGSACQASILFADIRGFTTMAEALTARETVELLNELFTEMYEAVAGANGVLDKYMGDAIMAVYGAPLASDQDALNAVTSAMEMLRMLDLINARRADRDAAPVRIGMGISTGEVVAGTIGSPKRMDYTVIGDSVNLAARLQELTKTYGVDLLLCEDTAAAVMGRMETREIDVIRVRGRKRPAKIFEAVAPSRAADIGRKASLVAYGKGRTNLLSRNWQGAIADFEEAVAQDPSDMPAKVMLDRARTLAQRTPESNWDGVWQSPAKTAAAA
ncbi:MAG: hypothetical protein B7Z43_01070 [Sphingomonas sp. 12-62-6]|nr:MAG: hypothetical protein B7Z43_01070 [Sphingomonas sp. 12-62-6]